jgi:glycine/sarcosine N-methyltransferase
MQSGEGSSPAHFYDDLAASYDRIYPNRELAFRRQGRALNVLLSNELGPGPHTIHDAAVGIGTQLLGLAEYGHRMSGTDISREAIKRARVECGNRGVDANLDVADMCALPFPSKTFDAVICVDNSLPHLMTEIDEVSALSEMARVTRRGGVVLVTIRDYEEVRWEQTPGTLPQISKTKAGETITFQVWDWHADRAHYDLQHFQLVGSENDWKVFSQRTSFWAITPPELFACATQANLVNTEWLMPEDTNFFQPVFMIRIPIPEDHS